VTVTIRTGDCRNILRELPDESVHCVVTSPPVVLAYCAGVIDSDGTIGIKRNTYAMRAVGDCTQATYSARICVRQVGVEALHVLSETFGGNVRPAKTYAKRGKPMWGWEIRDAIAERALTALLPYLRIKRAQAENCLALRSIIAKSKIVRVARGRGHAGAAPRPAHITEAMELAYLRAKELNAVGVGERRLPCP
jgi:hypothetical protein